MDVADCLWAVAGWSTCKWTKAYTKIGTSQLVRDLCTYELLLRRRILKSLTGLHLRFDGDHSVVGNQELFAPNSSVAISYAIAFLVSSRYNITLGGKGSICIKSISPEVIGDRECYYLMALLATVVLLFTSISLPLFLQLCFPDKRGLLSAS